MSGCDPAPVPKAEAPAVVPDVAARAAGPRLAAPTDPAAAILEIPALQGRWQVTGVAIADGPVQAYVTDDPAYMGQSLTIADTRLAWVPPAKATGANLDDVCEGAATMRLEGKAADAAITGLTAALASLGVTRPVPHEVACLDSGGWGGSDGGAVLFPIDDRTMAMRWYDNVVLKLRWQGAA